MVNVDIEHRFFMVHSTGFGRERGSLSHFGGEILFGVWGIFGVGCDLSNDVKSQMQAIGRVGCA